MTRLPYNGQAARNLYPNHETEYYSDNSVGQNPFNISNGVLSITASPAAAGSNPYNLPYDSGIITTRYSLSQLYGYVEVRADLPAGKGLWPAFWFKPVNGTAVAELDAFEVLGSEPTHLYVTTHDRSSGKDVTQARRPTVANTSTGFHTYGVDWEPTTISFYMDGVVVATMPTPSSMHIPMYMLLNLAVGGAGSWPGAPSSRSEFPASFKIDYVRAYATANTRDVTGTAALARPTTPTAPAPTATALSLSGNGTQLVRGNGNYAVTGSVNNGVLTLGDGNQAITLSGTGDTVVVGTGTSTIDIRGDRSTVKVDGGKVTLAASGLYDAVALTNGTGNVTLGSGYATVTVDGYVGATDAAGGDFTLRLAGTHNHISAVAHNLTVTGGGGSSTFLLAGDAAAERANAVSHDPTRSYTVTTGGQYNAFDLFDDVRNTIVTGQDGARVTVTDPAPGAPGSLGTAPTSITFGGLNNALDDTGQADVTLSGGEGRGTFVLGDGNDTLSTGGWGNKVVAGAGDDVIDAGEGNATIQLNATNVAATVHGTGDRVVFSRGAHGSVTDDSQGLHLAVADGVGTVDLRGAADDAALVVSLLGGAGGYASAAEAAAAIQPDGVGGSILAIGAGALHFEGMPSVTAPGFHIG